MKVKQTPTQTKYSKLPTTECWGQIPHPQRGSLPLTKRTGASALASPHRLLPEASVIPPVPALSARPQPCSPGISFPPTVSMANALTSHFTCRMRANPRAPENGLSDPTNADPLFLL